jgi:Arc/MetJ-type ribon-helix-helix transcriptional regulator
MVAIITDDIGVSLKDNKQGRNARAIVYGEYRSPSEVINKAIDKRRELFPDYELSDETLKWINDFEAEKQAELEALK